MPVHKLDYFSRAAPRKTLDVMRGVRNREIQRQIWLAAVLALCGAVVAGLLLILFNGA